MIGQTRHLSDGTVLSGATSTHRGGDARRTCPSLARGIVVAYQPRDESPLQIPTVDVLLPRLGLLCQYVPINVGGALGNGAAWTPAACTNFDSSRWDQNIDELDGDRVLVGFIEDDPALPVVVGVMSSRAADWLPRQADGIVRVLQHQGTVVRLDTRGNLEVDTTAAPRENGRSVTGPGAAGRITLKVGASSQVEIQVGGHQRVLVQDGKVILEAAEIDLGASATEHAILGDKFKDLYNQLTVPSPFGPLGPPTVPMTALHLSQKTRVE